MKRNSRIFLTVFGRPFLRRLVLPLGLLLLGVSQADATVDWSASREAMEARAPWQTALVIAVLFLCWGVAAGRAFRAVWSQPVMRFLVRQPLSRGAWVRCLAPSLSPAFLPVAGICWLAPRYGNAIVHYAGFVGLAWPIILGASYRGCSAATWIVAGTACVAMLTLAYAYQPAAAYLALVLTILLIPLSVSAIREQIIDVEQVDSRHVASSSPVFAILRRDLLYLWRVQKHSLLGLASLGALAALAMLALRVNGQVVGREAFESACALLAVALLPTYEILERLKTGLGRELMRRWWPVDHFARSVALMSLTLVLMGPAVISMALLGSTMGVGYSTLFLLYAATSLVTVAALFSLSLAEPHGSHGWSLLMLLVHAALAIALSPWMYAVSAALTLAVGCALVIRGLRRFTHPMGRGILE